jgi:peptidoglycan/xylan/chitin deacetylase (PgdA/CDA1 family)
MRLSGGFVLAFHDIQPDRLSELIDSIRPAQAISLPELVDRSKASKSTAGLFAITVDDGVGETVRSLTRLFQARGWPATFYIATNYLDSKDGMGFQWWRNLLPFLPPRKIELKDRVIDLSRQGSLRDFSRELEVMWHSQRMETYLPITLELATLVAREMGVSIDTLRPPEPITWAEVNQISRDESIRFESHGVSHAAMSTLNDDELTFEMKYSRDLITQHTGRHCRHLAYPFGSSRSIGMRAAFLARQLYDSAATMILGGVDSANPWMLPRIPLYPENSTWYANLKILLKCSRFGAKSIREADLLVAEPATSLIRRSSV